MGAFLIILFLSGILYILYKQFLKEGGVPAAMCQFGFHKFESWTYVHENTCEKRTSCRLCGKVAAGSESKVEHLWMSDYLHENSCEQQDLCLRCKETRGLVTVEHTWQQLFIGENSNQKHKVCKRCSARTAVEISQTQWPWLFEEGSRRSHFLSLQQALQELSLSNDMFSVADEARGKSVKIVKTFVPNTNVVLRGFSIGDVDLMFYPDGLHALQNPGRSLASIETYSTLSCQISRIQVEDSQVPKDAEVIKRTWLYSSYDGSPDPRYSDNPSIAILAYALFTFATGQAGKFKVAISNNRSAQRFYEALTAYLQSYRTEPEGSEPHTQHAYSSSSYDRQHESGHSSQNADSQSSSGRGQAGPLTREASYKILGIRNGAAWDEIRRAYLEMVRKYHPDKVFNLAEEYKVIAEEKMKEFNAAYDLLKERAP
jgi:DnaJ-domain-containing protein 1